MAVLQERHGCRTEADTGLATDSEAICAKLEAERNARGAMRLRILLRPARLHPGLLAGCIAAFVSAWIIPAPVSLLLRGIMAWDMLVLVFLATTWTVMLRGGRETMRYRAAHYDTSELGAARPLSACRHRQPRGDHRHGGRPKRHAPGQEDVPPDPRGDYGGGLMALPPHCARAPLRASLLLAQTKPAARRPSWRA